MTRTQAQKDCLAAADLIEKKGWTKGKVKYRGRFCLMGAVSEVTRSHERYSAVNGLLWNLLSGEVPIMYNDRQTTRKPVLQLLRRAGGIKG